ncbi:MAG: hypothetical protein ACOY93_07120 [Bacillota bacterium]
MRVGAASAASPLASQRSAVVLDALTDFVRREVGRQRRAAEIEGKRLPYDHPDLVLRGWGNPNAVASRIVQTAIASVGREQSQLLAAREAIRRGFTLMDRVLGGLPPVSEETRKLVELKFEKFFHQVY